MPNIKSAVKRVKTSSIREARNKSVKSGVATLKKKFLDAVASGDKAAADKAYRTYMSGVDKAAKKGILKKGNADRRKARATAKVKAL